MKPLLSIKHFCFHQRNDNGGGIFQWICKLRGFSKVMFEGMVRKEVLEIKDMLIKIKKTWKKGRIEAKSKII